jgi:hypothetical protein
VNPFVEECRREWKRLGVPDPVANEMAADLEVDLAEAEADGTSAEEVLGTGAFDAPSFAAAWAEERGVVPRATETAKPRGRVPRAAIAIAGFALVAVVGAVLLVVTVHSSEARLAAGAPLLKARAFQRIEALPRIVHRGRLHLVLPPLGRAVVVPVPVPSPLGGRVVVVNDNNAASAGSIAGLVLLLVGLAGIVFSAAYMLWTRSARRPAAAG